MRGRIGMLMNHSSSSTPIIGRTTKLLSSSSCSFSSFGGDGDGNNNGGGGRGRGSGSGASNSPLYNFVNAKTEGDSSNDQPYGRGHGHGHGHGRGKPLPSSSFAAPDHQSQSHSQSGLSRGRGAPMNEPPKRPIFLRKDESSGGTSEADFVASEPRRPIGEKDLPDSILSVLPGTGRGQPLKSPSSHTPPMEENRHLRAPRHPPPPPPPPPAGRGAETPTKANAAAPRPKLSREEATRKAVGILSKGDDARDSSSNRQTGGPKSKYDSDDEDGDDDMDAAAFLGNDADGEKFAQKLGPTLMADLTEAFDDMSFDVLPDLKFDQQIDAFDTNLKIELEPEYMMGDFETNPVIDEKPPIPLDEALEKMKPFLMACEGLNTQEEWQEAVKSTMDEVPLMKEIVDHYCGPDRVTAKQQHEELERVAKTIPPNVPNSVKRFTDRAVLSLQSNPGWGFHRKWQFMDKLVDEVSKSQK